MLPWALNLLRTHAIVNIVEVSLQIQTSTVYVLAFIFQISSTTSKLTCFARETTIPPPFS
jgi:hypothetical protein